MAQKYVSLWFTVVTMFDVLKVGVLVETLLRVNFFKQFYVCMCVGR